MRSSTSVSETPPIRLEPEPASRATADTTAWTAMRRATWMLVTGCLVVAAVVEIAARVGLDRASRIQRRMVQEYGVARTIGHDGAPGRHVLVVGNSLLDE